MELTTFKHSKKLKALGIKQKSIFVWSLPTSVKGCTPHITTNNDKSARVLFYSAYTVTELLDLLPIHIKTEYTKNNPDICKLTITKDTKYTAGYLYTEKSDKKLVNALAKLLIHITK